MNKLSALIFAALLCAASPAMAEQVNLQIRIKDHRFEPAELKGPAGQPITLRIINADPSPEEFESRDLRIEHLIGPNGERTFTLRPLKPGRYQFFGEFHEETAKGFLVIE